MKPLSLEVDMARSVIAVVPVKVLEQAAEKAERLLALLSARREIVRNEKGRAIGARIGQVGAPPPRPDGDVMSVLMARLDQLLAAASASREIEFDDNGRAKAIRLKRT